MTASRMIEREECSVCGAEVRGQVWSCSHPFTDPRETGRQQEPTPTVTTRYVEMSEAPLTREELAKAIGPGAISTDPWWLGSVPAAERVLERLEACGVRVEEAA